MAEEAPSFAANLISALRSEMEGSIKSLLKKGKKSRKDFPSSPSDSASVSSQAEKSSSSDSSDSDTGGKPCFPVEDTDALLKAIRTTMGLQEERAAKTLEDVMFGGLQERKKRTFPVNAKIQALIEKEWKEPEKSGALPSASKRRYPFEYKDTEVWDKVPKIDAAVSRSSKRSALPLEDAGVLRDPLDKKADSYLRHAWEVTAGGLKPAIAGTCTARSLMIWLQQLEEKLASRVPREKILSDMYLLHGAAAFLADTSADSMRLTARAASLSNAARRALWLKGCPGDLQSKAKLCSLPCDGRFLFGKNLDDILEKAGDKKKGFPRFPMDQRRQPFRRGRFNRGRPPADRRRWEDKRKNQGLCLVEAPPPQKSHHNDAGIPVGGRLALFFQAWEKISNTWILSILKEGLKIPFIRQPKPVVVITPIRKLTEEQLALETEILSLIDKRVLSEVPRLQEGKGFYSPLFLIKKPDQSFSTIINLRCLNL
ncbi:uncharacterized protein [Dendrobates tinctorius]|uniref:uncharacterized protein n=1 Tax=Dendrobates tinctorius TaxID=92724 RepID=UPI003CCA681F